MLKTDTGDLVSWEFRGYQGIIEVEIVCPGCPGEVVFLILCWFVDFHEFTVIMIFLVLIYIYWFSRVYSFIHFIVVYPGYLFYNYSTSILLLSYTYLSAASNSTFILVVFCLLLYYYVVYIVFLHPYFFLIFSLFLSFYVVLVCLLVYCSVIYIVLLIFSLG